MKIYQSMDGWIHGRMPTLVFRCLHGRGIGKVLFFYEGETSSQAKGRKSLVRLMSRAIEISLAPEKPSVAKCI